MTKEQTVAQIAREHAEAIKRNSRGPGDTPHKGLPARPPAPVNPSKTRRPA